MNLSSINSDRILNAIIATQLRQQSHIFRLNHHSNLLLYNQSISSSKYSSVKLQISLFHQKILKFSRRNNLTMVYIHTRNEEELTAPPHSGM